MPLVRLARRGATNEGSAHAFGTVGTPSLEAAGISFRHASLQVCLDKEESFAVGMSMFCHSLH